MKRLIFIILTIAIQAHILLAQAPFKFGVRAGLNSSNITEKRLSVDSEGLTSANWNKGFFIGAVVDMPISRSFTLQPGAFFDRRNADFASLFSRNNTTDNQTSLDAVYTEGSTSTNWLHVPVLVSYKLNLIQWFGINLEFGPYIAWGISGSNKYKTILTDNNSSAEDYPEISISCFKGDDALYFRTDWGFKAGGGIVLFKKCFIGAHYIFGMRNLAKNKQFVSKSHTREWQFSIGYNF